ncbi:MAG: hypothetical protein ACM3X3_03420 [Betaproteobacteria bacterium]
MPSMLDWSSAASMLRMLTQSGAAAGVALAAATLALFFTLGRQRLSGTQVAGGGLGLVLGAALFAYLIFLVRGAKRGERND